MRALRIFKKLISIYGICILGMSICLVIILNSKKQVRELKQEFENKVKTTDSLATPVDTAVTWFNNYRIYQYKSIDTMVADYDHGRELNIYFEYAD